MTHEENLREILTPDSVDEYDYTRVLSTPGNRFAKVTKPVVHSIEGWVGLIDLINNGKFKIKEPAVSKTRGSNYGAVKPIGNYYIAQSAVLSYKKKKITIRDPEFLNFKQIHNDYDNRRKFPVICESLKLTRVFNKDILEKVLDYVHDSCQPRLKDLHDEYANAWNQTLAQSENVLNAHFAKIGDDSRAKLRDKLSNFLKDSKILDMDDDVILTLLGQTYNSLIAFSNFVHTNRHEIQMATVEDIEVAKDLAKCAQVIDQ